MYVDPEASVSAAVGVEGVVLFADDEELPICQAGIPARAPLLLSVAERRDDNPSVGDATEAATGVVGAAAVGVEGALDACSSTVDEARLMKRDFNDFISF
jgi:hypothetical protein